ncbi:MAG: NAD-dependent deacylase [Leptospiraceae bacterium]|nr:NAD-dependent deacylase [Leptospiraceae bacterium]
MQTDIDACRAAVAAAKQVAVITGAGVSKESGIPTFRGKEGYWKENRPEDLATPAAFAANPKLVHEWYSHRRTVCHQAEPNAAHRAIAALEKQKAQFLLITQNVDGLHKRAGSRRLVEVHGNIFRGRCTACSYTVDVNLEPEPAIALQCPACAANVRPDIVWFGESYHPADLQTCYQFLHHTDLVIVSGTSGVVQIPLHLTQVARERGARVIDVNPDNTAVSELADWHLAGPAGEILPQLV